MKSKSQRPKSIDNQLIELIFALKGDYKPHALGWSPGDGWEGRMCGPGRPPKHVVRLRRFF